MYATTAAPANAWKSLNAIGATSALPESRLKCDVSRISGDVERTNPIGGFDPWDSVLRLIPVLHEQPDKSGKHSGES